MTAADRKLRKQIADWRSLCPEDSSEIENVDKASTATDRLERELQAAKSSLQGKSPDYEEFTADEIRKTLKTLKDYRKELSEQEQTLAELKKWLARVRTSSSPLPFALVAKGNSKGSLHVYKQEGLVERKAKSGKREISGAKIFDGECVYDGGKLVFKFDDGPRAPWKALLQDIIDRAGVNMKVKLDGLGDDSDDASGGQRVS